MGAPFTSSCELTATWPCGATTLAAKQYYFVKLSSGTIVICSADTDDALGVLQNAPAVGEMARVMLVGITPVVSGAALSEGNRVGPDANGKAEAKTIGTHTTKYIPGYVIVASSAGDALATIVLSISGRAA